MVGDIDLRRHRAALPVFTPSAVAPQALAMRTVGRESQIERLVRAIRTAATTDNRPHQLIVGPRGSGKSHLLIVALHEALADERVAERVAVAMLPEDAVEIAGYEDLLVSIIDRAFGTDDYRDEARDLRSRHDVAGLEQRMLERLGDRVLVLVVENLDRVFRDLGDRGQARLRNLTETSGRLVLLASTPLLFDAVSDHARPWYGSFDVEHLRELDAEQGRELLQRVAAAANDDDLAASLQTTTGLARVRAVEHLAGGSPRMWTVLAGCITVELLDELVPLVEALFDELAPYYQQRLWELAGVERKLVYELCRVRAATVKELAHSTGLSQRAAATSLGRLHEAGWVRREKRAGADQRATWYSLREPLLRHHVEYRETGGDQLPAIVGFLRIWYEVQELAAQLATVSLATLAEAYLLAALSGADQVSWLGAWPAVGSCDDLVTAARSWIVETRDDGVASFVTGVVCEAVGLAARDGLAVARGAVTARLAREPASRGDDLLRVVEEALVAVREPVDDPVDACRRGLRAACESQGQLDDRDRLALGLLGEAIGGATAEASWFELHEALAQRLPASEDRLRLIFRTMKAVAEFSPASPGTLAGVTDALRACSVRLGSHDPTTRSVVGWCVFLSGLESDIAELRRCSATVVDLSRDAPAAQELTRYLVWSWLLRLALPTIPQEAQDRWLVVWADATRGSELLGPIHRYLSRALDADPLDFEDLSAEDRAALGSAIEDLAREVRRRDLTPTPSVRPIDGASSRR